MLETPCNIKKLADDKSIRLFFVICWITYFSTYIGRLNFSASMEAMIVKESFTKSQLGLVAAAFFFAYGIGQFISGILGDKINPKILVFMGVAGSAAINLMMGMCTAYRIMVLLWFVNGLMQSLTWSPISRIVTDRLPEKKCSRVFVNLSTTVPVGTLLTYFICSLAIKYLNWRMSFYFAAFFMLFIAIIWYVFITKLEHKADTYGISENINSNSGVGTEGPSTAIPIRRIIMVSGLIFIAVAAMLHGVLKDGIMSWVPTYLAESFKTSSAFSLQLTMLLPIINLFGVYFSNYLNNRFFRNELVTAACFFIITVLALLILVNYGNKNIYLSVAMLGIITSSMLGVNTMLVSLIPLYFRRYGKVSTVCGLLNSSTYLGSAISSFGIGAMAEKFGWAITRVSWFILALVGVIVCMLVYKRWSKFIKGDML